MRTMRGRIIDPVELVRRQPFDDFPYKPGCRGQIGETYHKSVNGTAMPIDGFFT